MFRDHTLFIVGAGASYELGLPTGEGLLSEIRQVLSFRNSGFYSPLHDHIREAIHLASGGGSFFTQAIQACDAICDGVEGAVSIDNFMHLHEDNKPLTMVAKIAITQSILQAELNSKLRLVGDKPRELKLPYENLRDTWLLQFIKILTTAVSKRDIDYIFDRVSFICFNYDRCIEHALWNALRQTCMLDAGEATALMGNLGIVHPYGVVGSLPWQGQPNPVAFGQVEQYDLGSVASNLRTFMEQERDKEVTDKVAQYIDTANKIVFLGFGYYRQNMEILDHSARNKSIYGTTFRMSEHDRTYVKNIVQSTFSVADRTVFGEPLRLDLPDCSCVDFFRNYSRTLGDI